MVDMWMDVDDGHVDGGHVFDVHVNVVTFVSFF